MATQHITKRWMLTRAEQIERERRAKVKQAIRLSRKTRRVL